MNRWVVCRGEQAQELWGACGVEGHNLEHLKESRPRNPKLGAEQLLSTLLELRWRGSRGGADESRWQRWEGEDFRGCG
jgi:hypothetical protein